jgi:hypothetical protein
MDTEISGAFRGIFEEKREELPLTNHQPAWYNKICSEGVASAGPFRAASQQPRRPKNVWLALICETHDGLTVVCFADLLPLRMREIPGQKPETRTDGG